MGIVDRVKNNVQSITGEAKSVDELAEDTDSILKDARSDEKKSSRSSANLKATGIRRI